MVKERLDFVGQPNDGNLVTKIGYKTKTDENFVVDVYKSSTWNCQIFSIAGIEDILTSTEGNVTVELMNECFQHGQKKLALIDISVDGYQSALKRLYKDFNDWVYCKFEPFKSTNGSMRMFMLLKKPD